MYFSEQLDPEEFWERIERTCDEIRQSFGRLPVWAPATWHGARATGEWTFAGGPHSLRCVNAAGAQLVVRTSIQDLRRAIATLLHRDVRARGADPSTPATLLRRGAPARGATWAARDVDLPLPDRVLEISVDGVLEPFEVWKADGVTRAAASVRGHALVFDAQSLEVDGMELAEVHDIEPYIAGMMASIRDLRAE